MDKKQVLEANLADAKRVVEAAEQALAEFSTSPENNVFATVEEASGVLEDRLRDQAFEDCQGAYNVGADSYEQEFIVDGKRYIALAQFEYNRHDKMYYYIDRSEFSVTEKPL